VTDRRLEIFACERLSARLLRRTCAFRSLRGDAVYISKDRVYAPSEWAPYVVCRGCAVGQAHVRLLGMELTNKPPETRFSRQRPDVTQPEVEVPPAVDLGVKVGAAVPMKGPLKAFQSPAVVPKKPAPKGVKETCSPSSSASRQRPSRVKRRSRSKKSA